MMTKTPSFQPSQLVDAVRNEMADTTKLLAELVSRDSLVGHEQRAQQFVEETLGDLGFSVRRQYIPEAIASDPLAGTPLLSYEDRFNVVGATEIVAGPTLLLNGHIDVVPVNEATWSTSPFGPVVNDGWLYGRGAGDMKGGFAMAFLAIKALRTVNPELINHNLSFVSVIEEECTGNGTLASIREGVTADVVVLPEPTDLGVLLGGVPITWVKVEISFGGGHAESSDRLASPAEVVYRMIEELKSLEGRLNEGPDGPVALLSRPYNLNIGVIRMGEWASSVPANLLMELRVGHPSRISDDDVISEVTALVRGVLQEQPELRFDVTSHGFRSEGFYLPESDSLVGALRTSHVAAHGVLPSAGVIGSTTDARYYLNELGVPAVCYGPVTRNMHGSNEAVSLESIAQGATTLATFMDAYLNHGGLSAWHDGSDW